MVTSELRRALGDSAASPSAIRTVHRRGYAFSARAETVDDARDSARFFLAIDARRFPLAEGETIVGRDDGFGIRLDEPSVSRRHARFLVQDDHVAVEDLNSTNGTLVNGRTAEGGAVSVQPGDTIRIGGVTARLDAPHALRSGKTVRLPGR